MKKASILKFQMVVCVLASVILSACGQGLSATPTLTMMPTEALTITVTPIPTNTNTPEPTATQEIKQFRVCTLEQFRECEITVKELFNGDYLKWLYTLSKPFDQENVIDDIPFIFVGWGEIIYDQEGSPHFEGANEGKEPFRREVTAAFVNYQGYDYMVLPIEFYDKNIPDQNQWVMTVYPLYDAGTWYVYSDEDVEHLIDVFKNEMNTTPMLTTSHDLFSKQPYPLVEMTYVLHPDIQERINRFTNFDNRDVGGQDMSALSEPGVVLLTQIVSGGFYK